MVWGLFIFLLTSLPVPSRAEVLPAWSDKAVHLALYAVFGVLLMRSLRAIAASTLQRALATVLVAAAVGALDEWHQAFIPGRHADRADWYADVFGGLTGSAFALALSRQELST